MSQFQLQTYYLVDSDSQIINIPQTYRILDIIVEKLITDGPPAESLMLICEADMTSLNHCITIQRYCPWSNQLINEFDQHINTIQYNQTIYSYYNMQSLLL